MPKGFYFKRTYIDWWINWTWWGFHTGEWRWNSGNPYKAYQIGPVSIRVFATPKNKRKKK